MQLVYDVLVGSQGQIWKINSLTKSQIVLFLVNTGRLPACLRLEHVQKRRDPQTCGLSVTVAADYEPMTNVTQLMTHNGLLRAAGLNGRNVTLQKSAFKS